MIEYSRSESPMSPHSFLAVVYKRRKTILVLLLLVIVAIVGTSFLLPPIFESKATVMIKYQPELEKYHLLDFYQPQRSEYDRLNSELVVLKMRSIVEPVVNSLNLDRPRTKSEIKDVSSASRRHEDAIQALSEALKVEREKDTNVLSVSYENKDPQLAANVVDKVITEYIEQRPSLDRDDRAYEYFEEQIQIVKKQIDDIEQRGMQYKNRESYIAPDKQAQILFQSAADFDQELTKKRAERISKEARLKITREQVSENEDEIVFPSTEISSSYSRFGYITELKNKLLEFDLKRNELLKKYTEKHPEVEVVDAAIAETKSKMRQELGDLVKAEETSLKVLKEEENVLAQRMNQVVASISKLSRQEYELGKITIGIDDLKAVYSMLIRQREEARLAATNREHLVQVRLLEPAMVSLHPVKPNKRLYAALAILLGLVISFGSAFFLEYFDHSINTVDDARHALGVPIIASIPDLPGGLSGSSKNKPGTEFEKMKID
jgi:polysaccharide biosynthesis transport protein